MQVQEIKDYCMSKPAFLSLLLANEIFIEVII